MTTIAYRNGILAADTQMTISNVAYKTSKIKRLNKNTAIACAGSGADEYRARQHFSLPDWKDHEPPKVKSNFECVLINKGQPYFCVGNLFPIKMEHDYYAIGSGGNFAMAGMATGLSAEEAVQFASELCLYTNDIIETFDVKEHQTKATKV